MRLLLLAMIAALFVSIAGAQEVQNASRAIVGYVLSDGAVQNSSRAPVGYVRAVRPRDATLVFFFFFQTELF